MTKKKLIITITSLCLVVVAAVAAVVGILAATQVNVNSKLTVSYTPRSAVYTKINAFYKKESGSKTPIITDETYDYNTNMNSVSTLNIDDQAVILDDTVTYVVFGFSFENTVNVADNPNAALLSIGATHNGQTTGTMNVYVRYSQSALTDENLTPEKVQELTDTTGTSLQDLSTGEVGYVYVAISRVAGKQGTYAPAADSSTFAFVLSAKAAA